MDRWNSRNRLVFLGCLIYVVQFAYLVLVQTLSDDGLGRFGIMITVALCVVFALVDAGVMRYLFSALRNIGRVQATSMDEQLKESLEGYRDVMRIEEQAVSDLARELEVELARARLALGSAGAEQVDEHLRRSLGIASSLGTFSCDNVTVAAVLENKQLQCQEAGITLDPCVSLPQELALPEIEVASLFFNLIDNARHECEALVGAGVKDPVIEVRALVQSGQLYVEVENPCRVDAASRRGEARAHDDLLRRHGWGTGIVEDIASRHGGIASLKAEGGRFVAQVMVPLAAA